MNEEATPANIKPTCLVNANITTPPPPPVWIALFAHSAWLIRDGTSWEFQDGGSLPLSRKRESPPPPPPSVSVPSDLDINLTATRFGKYQSLATCTSPALFARSDWSKKVNIQPYLLFGIHARTSDVFINAFMNLFI